MILRDGSVCSNSPKSFVMHSYYGSNQRKKGNLGKCICEAKPVSNQDVLTVS